LRERGEEREREATVGKWEICDERVARARKYCIMYSRQRKREDQRYSEWGGVM